MRTGPLLLALDEPTAGLDPAAEADYFARYASMTDRTGDAATVTLLITHRFSTVSLADMIVVLAEGGVAEVGSHAELLALGGLYAELYGLQARGYR